MGVPLYAGANVSIGNGVTTVFPYNFKILDQAHVQVTVDSVVQGSGYTVSGVGASGGGNVTFAVAPAVGAVVQRARKVPYARTTTDYQYNGDLKNDAVNTDFDLEEMQVQQLAADIARAFKAPLSNTLDMTISDAGWLTRAGKYIRVTLDGLGIELVDAVYSLGNFLASSVGAVSRTAASKMGERISVKDFGAVCDGVTDDYAAIMRAHDNAPVGSTIFIEGNCYYTTPLVFTRKLNWICEGESDFLHPGLTNVQDALTVTGTANTLPMQLKINMFGAVNCCSNGLVLRNVHYSDVKANVQVGAANYSYKILGCLLSWFRLQSSVNHTNALGSPNVGAKHLFADIYNAVNINANVFDVQFEGGGAGVTIPNQVNGGNSAWRGTIEGTTGPAFTVTGCYGMSIRDIHLEGNTASLFTNCVNVRFESGYASLNTMNLVGCTSCRFDNWLGAFTTDAATNFTRVGVLRLGAGDTISDSSKTTVYEQGVGLDSSATRLVGGGDNVIENIFFNPFCDIFSAGVAAPDGWTIGSGALAREVGLTYPGNPTGVSIYCASTAVGLANCAKAAPVGPYLTMAEDTWVSIMVPVYVAGGNPDLTVNVFDGVGYTAIATVTQKDSWQVVRGSVLILAGRTVSVVFQPGATVAGNFYVGGISIVKGTASPRFLSDHGKRQEYVVTAVGYTPSFKGQKAYVVGTGKWYLAAGTTNAADWIILN